MLRYILFDTTLFGSGEPDIEETRTDLMWIMEALTQRNQNYLKQRPNTPPLYKSGVVYKLPAQFDGECPEVTTLKKVLGKTASQTDVAAVLDDMQNVFGGERFRDIGRIIENGGGDCDNLACWRVAELRQQGIAAKPYMTNRERSDGGTTYHALVQWPPFANVPYPTSEDPSLMLGMSQPKRAADRQEEIRKNTERMQLIRQYGVAPVASVPAMSQSYVSDYDMENTLQDVLGLRPRSQSTMAVRDLSEIAGLTKRGL